MKVIFCIRDDFLTRVGGDTIQLLNTKECLESMYGIRTLIETEPYKLKESGTDIVHIFNAQTLDLSLKFALNAKNAGKKIVLSPIFWDLSHSLFVTHLAKVGILNIRKGYRLLKKPHDFAIYLLGFLSKKYYFGSKRYINDLTKLISLSDLILPNSPEELKILENTTKIRHLKYKIVVNDVNQKIFKPVAKINNNKTVLIAGRIEPVKNQLSVARALMNDREIKIIMVGAISNKRYFDAILKIAKTRGNIEIIPENISQFDLYDIYKKSDIHVLPSFRDSPGRSTLEAISVGLKAVVSSSAFCPVDFYFRELINKKVFICDPYSIYSIRSAILKALATPSYGESIEFRFSCEKATEQTFNAYKEILT